MKVATIFSIGVAACQWLGSNGEHLLKSSRSPGQLASETNRENTKIARRADSFKTITAILFKDASVAEKKEFFEDFDEFVDSRHFDDNIINFMIPNALEDDVILDIRGRGIVQVVEHVVELRENDLYWNKQRIGVRSIKDVNSRTESIIYQGTGKDTWMYIIDSGVDDHPQFGTRIDRTLSKNFASGRDADDSYDCRGHGTNVAGVAAGIDTGVAIQANIVSYSVMHCETGVALTSTIVSALDSVRLDAQANPSRKIIVNLSNGFTGSGSDNDSIKLAEDMLFAENVIIVRAAGNHGLDACDYGQQDLHSSLSVGFVDDDDIVHGRSNIGDCVDIYAPGADITVPLHDKKKNSGKKFGYATGSSFSAPLVAGAAAVVWSLNPTWTASDVTSYIVDSSTTGNIKNLPLGSHNRLLYLDAIPGNFEAEGLTLANAKNFHLEVDLANMFTEELNSKANVFCAMGYSVPADSLEEAKRIAYQSTYEYFIMDVFGEGNVFRLFDIPWLSWTDYIVSKHCVTESFDRIDNGTHTTGTLYYISSFRISTSGGYVRGPPMDIGIDLPVKTPSVALVSTQPTIEDCVEEFKIKTVNVLQYYPELKENNCKLSKTDFYKVPLRKGDNTTRSFIYTSVTHLVIQTEINDFISPKSYLNNEVGIGCLYCGLYGATYHNVQSSSECVERATFLKGSAARYNQNRKECRVCTGGGLNFDVDYGYNYMFANYINPEYAYGFTERKEIPLTGYRFVPNLKLSDAAIPARPNANVKIDLAGKTVNCSSEYSSGYACSMLIDDNIGSTAITNETNNPTLKFFEIDLKTIYKITGFEMYNRQDCCPERINGFQIQILDENRTIVKDFDYSEWNEASALLYHRAQIEKAYGRYFRISLETNTHLQVGEVVLYGYSEGASMQNIARGKTVSGSLGHTGYELSLAVDGIKNLVNTGYLSQAITNTWFEVDLGDYYFIYEINILQRQFDAWRMDGAIFTLLDGNMQEVYRFYQSEWPVSAYDYTKTFTTPVRARYFRIDNPTDPLQLRELEIYGEQRVLDISGNSCPVYLDVDNLTCFNHTYSENCAFKMLKNGRIQIKSMTGSFADTQRLQEFWQGRSVSVHDVVSLEYYDLEVVTCLDTTDYNQPKHDTTDYYQPENALMSCERPSDWCSHAGSIYTAEDCDGDSFADHTCRDDQGQYGSLLSSDSCRDTWGTGAVCVVERTIFDYQFVGGDDLGEIPNIVSYQKCDTACKTTNNCKYWNYESSSATCWVKSSVDGETRQPGMVSSEVGLIESGAEEGCILKSTLEWEYEWVGDSFHLDSLYLEYNILGGPSWHACKKALLQPHFSEVNAFEIELRENLVKCLLFICPASDIAGYPTYDASVMTNENRAIRSYVKDNFIVSEIAGFSLIKSPLSVENPREKLKCNGFRSIVNITLEGCHYYSKNINANAFNYRMGHMLCEPKQCSSDDIDEAEVVSEDGWLMYFSHVTDYEHILLVHLNPEISEVELSVIQNSYPNSVYKSGDSPLNFKQLVITMDHTIDMDRLMNDENVHKVENYGTSDFSTVFYDLSKGIKKSPLERIDAVFEGGSMDYYSGSKSTKEKHSLDTTSNNQMRKVAHKYMSANSNFGNQGETGYAIKTGGSGKSKGFLGEFGVPMILNGEFETKFLNGEFETKWLNGEFENKWLNGEYETKWLNGEFETKFLNGEFEDKWLNGEYETKFLNGEFESKFLNGEFEDKWLNGEYDTKWLNGEFETKWLNGEWGAKWLNGEHETKWLNGEFEYKWLNGEFEVKFLNGEFETKWLNGEFGLSILNGDFGLPLLHGDFGLSILNGDFGFPFFESEDAFPRIGGHLGKPYIIGSNNRVENDDKLVDYLFSDLLEQNKHAGGFHFLDFSYLDSDIGNDLIDGITVAEVHHPGVAQANGRFFKLRSDETKSSHLDCSVVEVFDEVDSVDECASKSALGWEHHSSRVSPSYPNVALNKLVTTTDDPTGSYDSALFSSDWMTVKATSNVKAYIEIDLGYDIIITNFVMKYNSNRPGNYFVIKDSSGQQVFGGFFKEHCGPERNWCDVYLGNVRARYIRFTEDLYNYGRVTLKEFQVFEFASLIVSPQVQTGLPSFSFSKQHGGIIDVLHDRGWLDSPQAWSCGSCIAGTDYYQINLESPSAVAGVVTQGRRSYAQYVTTYKVKYSADGVTYHDVEGGTIFSGNTAGDNTRVTNRFSAVSAKYIRIYPMTWYSHASMRTGVIIENAEYADEIIEAATWKNLLNNGQFADLEESSANFEEPIVENANFKDWQITGDSHGADNGFGDSSLGGMPPAETENGRHIFIGSDSQLVQEFPMAPLVRRYCYLQFKTGYSEITTNATVTYVISAQLYPMNLEDGEVDVYTLFTRTFEVSDVSPAPFLWGTYERLFLLKNDWSYYSHTASLGDGGLLLTISTTHESLHIDDIRLECIENSGTYKKYTTGGCGRKELGEFENFSFEKCQLECDLSSYCISFEYNEHTSLCRLSNTCTYEASAQDPRSLNILYVKLRSLDCPHQETFSPMDSEWERNVALCKNRAEFMGFTGFNMDKFGNCDMKLCLGEPVFSASDLSHDVYVLKDSSFNIIKNSGFELPREKINDSYDKMIPIADWNYGPTIDNNIGRINKRHDFVHMPVTAQAALSKHMYIDTNSLYQMVYHELIGKTCNFYADIASRKAGNMRDSFFKFSMSDSTGRTFYSGESVSLDDFSSPGTWVGFSDQFRVPDESVAPYKFVIENSGGQIHIDNIKMYCIKPVSGFNYSPTFKQCITKECKHGIYDVVDSAAGWLSYIALGYYPSEYKGFQLVPMNKKGRLSCENGEGDGAIFSNVINIEACIESASTRDEPIINFKVSKGECEVLSCGLSPVIRNSTRESDVYSYIKEGVNLVELAGETTISASVGTFFGPVIQQDDYIKISGSTPLCSVELLLSREYAHAEYQVWNDNDGPISMEFLVRTIEGTLWMEFADDAEEFVSKRQYISSVADWGWVTKTFNAKRGINTLWISSRYQSPQIKQLSIASANAHFYRKKSFPIIWDDYVTMNVDFSNGEDRGRKLLTVSQPMTDGVLEVARKETRPDISTFQLRRPVTSASFSECIRWFDNVVITSKYSDVGEDCGPYGCRVGKVVSNRMQFSSGGSDPYTFKILPPLDAETVSPSTPTGDISFSYNGIHSSCNPGLSGWLDASKGWCAATNSPGTAYYQINLGYTRTLVGVVIQGRGASTQWVKTFTAKHSNDGVSWFLVDNGAVFNGNTDMTTKVKVHFQNSVVAKFVRIYPQTYQGHMSMRSGALVKNGSESCIHANDRFRLADSSGSNFLSISSTGSNVDFSTTGISLTTFRHVYNNRVIKWRDHVVINSGFKENENPSGDSLLHTMGLGEGVEFVIHKRSEIPHLSSFRLLQPEVFNGKTTECVSWGDEVVLKLNNVEEGEGCSSNYGCRVLTYDNGLRFLPRTEENSEVKFYIAPFGAIERNGCVHSGEQFQLSPIGLSPLTQTVGNCIVYNDGSCIKTPNHPNNYGNDERCEFTSGVEGYLVVNSFETEANYDKLVFSDEFFDGTNGPVNKQIITGETFYFDTDRSVTRPGFDICVVLTDTRPYPKFEITHSRPSWIKHTETACARQGFSYSTLQEAQEECFHRGESCTGIYDYHCDDKYFYLCRGDASPYSTSSNYCYYEPVFENNFKLPSSSEPEWTQTTLKHCQEAKFAQHYFTLSEAKEACLEMGNLCGGIYDNSCDSTTFYLCHPGVTFSTSSSSCIYETDFTTSVQPIVEVEATYATVNGIFTLQGDIVTAHSIPVEWRYTAETYCSQYGSETFSTLSEALSQCTLLGSNCTGVYDSNCDNTGSFKTCEPGNRYSGSTTGCFYESDPTSADGFASYEIYVGTSGNIVFEIECSGGSFSMYSDNDPTNIVVVEANDTLGWKSATLNLSNGLHTMFIAYREDFTSFRSFKIVSGVAQFLPTRATLCDNSNLALGKYVTSSSASPNYPPPLLVDGISTNFMHTAKEADPWVEIDLGATYHIGDIIIRNRADCCQERIVGFKVQILDLYHSEISSFGYWEWNSVLPIYKRYVGGKSHRARFIRLTLVDKTEYLNLSEIEIYEDRKNCGFPRENVFAFQTFT